jgi:hypothetical protein
VVQSAQLADLFDSWPQIKMVGIAQKDLHTEVFQDVLRDTFYGRHRADRHEDRGFDYAVGCGQAAGPGWAVGGVDLKRN